jgi:hypothetical protein
VARNKKLTIGDIQIGLDGLHPVYSSKDGLDLIAIQTKLAEYSSFIEEWLDASDLQAKQPSAIDQTGPRAGQPSLPVWASLVKSSDPKQRAAGKFIREQVRAGLPEDGAIEMWNRLTHMRIAKKR